jgi:GH35 family endo-1,4-beta-xylanase
MIRYTTNTKNSLVQTVVNAHLLTRDNQVVQGRVNIENGIISTQAAGHTSFALCLLFDAGSAGRLMLQTSILPPRDEPYMLELELARHRIKSFLDMSENWSLFHLSDENPAILRWEESRLIFTKALVAVDQDEARELACKALELSIDASERLTMAHAQILLHRRYSKKPASSSTLGVRVEVARFDQPLRDLLDKHVDIMTIPMRWTQIEPEEGTFEWGNIDRWVKWARDHKKHVIAGPLLDFTIKDSIPEWVKVWEHDYTTFRDKCYDHLERVVHRYGSAISFWNIVSGININRYIRLSTANMVDLVRTATLVVRQARKGTKVMIEIAEPFSEFVATIPDACSHSVFLSRLAQEGIRFDALGVQCLVGIDGGRATRDLMQLSARLDEFLHVEVPLVISALGAPSETIDEEFGWWKSHWDEKRQEQWAGQMLAIALSKPYIDSVIWSDLYDHNMMDIPTSAFVSESGKPRAVLNRMLTMRRRLTKPLGPLDLPKRTQVDKESA